MWAPDGLLQVWIGQQQSACPCVQVQHMPALQQPDSGRPTSQWRVPNQPWTRIIKMLNDMYASREWPGAQMAEPTQAVAGPKKRDQQSHHLVQFHHNM